MNSQMATEFKAAIGKIKANHDLRVLILTGSGKSFSTGGNLENIRSNIGTNPVVMKNSTLNYYNSFLSIRDLSIPTIAVINGHAIGAGACLSLACDMRLAANDAKIGFTFAKIGLYPGMGAEYFLSRIVGRARTFELLMTGAILTAEEAYRIGLVNHIYPIEELMGKAESLASEIASMPVLPIRMLKDSIDASMSGTLEETLKREASYQGLCYMTDDISEGISSVEEKRAPRFNDDYS